MPGSGRIASGNYGGAACRLGGRLHQAPTPREPRRVREQAREPVRPGRPGNRRRTGAARRKRLPFRSEIVTFGRPRSYYTIREPFGPQGDWMAASTPPCRIRGSAAASAPKAVSRRCLRRTARPPCPPGRGRPLAGRAGRVNARSPGLSQRAPITWHASPATLGAALSRLPAP